MPKALLLLCLTALLGAVLPATGAAADQSKARVTMATTLGDIVLELDAERAPLSTANFLRYAEDGYYDGTIFHRVIPGFMVQAGGFNPDVTKRDAGLRPPIKNEWENGLKNDRGTIAMARLGSGPNSADSATSQFFINLVDNNRLDQPQRDGAAYAVFGRVVEGMDVVDAIAAVEKIVHPNYPSQGQAVVPAEPIIIESVTLHEGFDAQALFDRVGDAERELVAARARAAEERLRERREAEERFMRDIIAQAEAEGGNTLQETESGLQYVIMREGTGRSPSPTNTVRVHYRGQFTNGEQFDSSYDRGAPAEFPLNGVIAGWTEGVGMMRVGEKRLLICPPDLAYGRGRPGIPPNSTLVFTVELLDIVN